MKNNAITIFVDSVVWDCIGTTRAKVSPTPFLDSLKKEGLVANKMYSHGPYTDAATRSLLTGRNCLDDFGYFFKLNSSPITHYKLFHDAGYETYDIHYPFYIKGDEISSYIDHRYYLSGFAWGSEWGGLFYYYSDVIKSRKLTEIELKLLTKRTRYMFESWERYLDDATNHLDTMRMHKKILETYDSAEALKVIRKEIESFEEDNETYIYKLLKEGNEHVLAKLDTSSIDTYIDPKYIKNVVEKKYNSFFRKIAWVNFKANFWKNRPTLKRIFWSIRQYFQTKDTSNFLFLQNYILSLTSMFLMKKRWARPHWQNCHSARTDLGTGLEVLKERKSDKPFYMFFHTGEPHNDIAFFSYDIQDENVLDEEMTVLKDYVNALGTDFIGNLVYFLSIRQTDYQIEKFCNGLKELGVWDSTSIMFVSDHGSSYTYYPLHNRRVNCFDDECYHVPFIIRHPGMKPISIDSYQYSKDVFPTFLDVLGIQPSPFFKGSSMLKEQSPRKYIITEYMGPGCPDITQRRIWFSARDEKYIVAYKVGFYEDFDDGELAEVYSLEKDPHGFYNISQQVDRAAIDYLMVPIKERFEEIKKDTTDFLDSL